MKTAVVTPATSIARATVSTAASFKRSGMAVQNRMSAPRPDRQRQTLELGADRQAVFGGRGVVDVEPDAALLDAELYDAMCARFMAGIGDGQHARAAHRAQSVARRLRPRSAGIEDVAACAALDPRHAA